MKKCKLPNKVGAKFSFSVKSQNLVKVLSRVDLVTKFSDADDTLTNVHLVVAYGGDVFIIGRTPDTFIAHHVAEAKADGDGAFNIDPKQLQGLVDKRAEVNLNFDGTAVNITSTTSKYSATFKTKTLASEQIPLVSEGLRHHVNGGNSIPDQLIELLTEGVRCTKIKDCYSPTNPVICRVECTGKELEVTSLTNWHASRFVAKLGKKLAKSVEPFRFSLSTQMFDLLYRVIDGQTAVLSADTTSFAAEADSFVLTLPPIQSSDADYRAVRDYYGSLQKPLIKSMLGPGLGATLSNIGSFVGKKEKPAVTITVGPKRASVSFANDSGNLTDAIKVISTSVKDKHPVRMDYTVLGEILKHVPDVSEGHSFDVYGNSIKELKMFSIHYETDVFSLDHLGYLPQ